MNSKNLTKKNALYVAMAMLCISLLFFDSCKEEGKSSGAVHDPSQPLALTSFSPDTGRISDMVVLEGMNFGTDTSLISVYFNQKKARVLGSTGTRILALTPRLPGDTCILTVKVGDKEAAYPGFFRYRIMASVRNFAGNGSYAFTAGTTLDNVQLCPVYIAVDDEYNVFVTIEQTSGTTGSLLKLNEAENSVTVLGTSLHGITPRFNPTADRKTGEILLGSEGIRDQFLILDPKEGYIPKPRYIKNWISNGFPLPAENGDIHYHLMSCPDGFYYTRYFVQGQIVKINRTTWEAEIIYQTPSGTTYGVAFHPLRPYELWMCYNEMAGNRICKLDVRDPDGTFENVTNGLIGHRDGRVDQALFNGMRQANFDPDGNLIIGDNGNHCIRMLNTETMMVETVIGRPGIQGSTNGSKELATFKNPHGIAVDRDGIIYVSDLGNNRVRRVAVE